MHLSVPPGTGPKITNALGEKTAPLLQKLYNDYEATHIASKKTTFSLPCDQLEKVFSNEELKNRIREDIAFKNYLQEVTRNSLAAISDEKKLSEAKKSFLALATITESAKLSELLRTSVRALGTRDGH